MIAGPLGVVCGTGGCFGPLGVDLLGGERFTGGFHSRGPSISDCLLTGECGGLPGGIALPGPILLFLADLPWNSPCNPYNNPWGSDVCGFGNNVQQPQLPGPLDFPPEFE